MATINGSTNNTNWTYKLEATESNVNVNNNASVVTVKAYLGRASTQGYLGGAWSGNIKVDGSTQSMSGTISYPTYINGGAWLLLATKTFTVTHNSDGSKKASITSSFSSSDFTPSSASASGTMTLTTIPRASTITGTSAYIGETSQLTVTRKNSSFTHTIQYSFGSLSGYILEDGSTTSTSTKISATSIGFPIPTSWFAEIPNSSSGTCTLRITTYNGNTQIGSTQTSTFVARVDSTTSSPQISSSVVDTNSTTIALTGNNNTLVKGYSIASVTWSASARDSATLSNVKINGTTITESPYNFTLNDSTINVVATDSRGLSTTSTPTFTLKDYSAPIYSISVLRVSPTSSYAKITFNGTWFNDNFGSITNSLTISWKYKKSEDTTWINGGTLIENTDYKISGNNFYSGNGSSANEIQIGGALEYNYGWDVALFVEDELNVVQANKSITKGIPIINWGDDFFNVNGDLEQNNISIIESDSNSNGDYIKFADGTMICRKNIVGNSSFALWYSPIIFADISIGSWAETFVSINSVLGTNNTTQTGILNINNFTITDGGTARLIGFNTSAMTKAYNFTVVAIGRWK